MLTPVNQCWNKAGNAEMAANDANDPEEGSDSKAEAWPQLLLWKLNVILLSFFFHDPKFLKFTKR